MNNRLIYSVSVFMLVQGCAPEEPSLHTAAMSVTQTLGRGDVDGYLKALEPREFIFPMDHGAHPEYKNEWWYFTGNLKTETSREIGYQFTLFRTAITPKARAGSSPWYSNQVYLAHISLSDIENDVFYHDEQFARPALDIAGVAFDPYRIRMGNWQVVGKEVDESGAFNVSLLSVHERFTLKLNLENTHYPVMHGNKGLSAKSPEPGNASYYYSYPELITSGTLKLDGQTMQLQGKSWFDHEWSTSTLADNQIGWDWFSLQLTDHSNIMIFQLRDRKHAKDNYYYGSFINTAGQVRTLDKSDFSMEVLSQWQSPTTGMTYPSKWRITLPGYDLDLYVEPKMQDQEISASFRYWEGAVTIMDSISDGEMLGQGYVELTGY